MGPPCLGSPAHPRALRRRARHGGRVEAGKGPNGDIGREVRRHGEPARSRVAGRALLPVPHRPRQPPRVDEALAELQAHAPDLSQETLRKPRIALLARNFSPMVTASVVWLNEMGLDITLVQISAFRSYIYGLSGADNVPMISVSQLYPLRDVEEFTISPERQLAREADDAKKRVQDASTVRRLVSAESVADGTIFTISPRGDLSHELGVQLDDWLHADPVRRSAHWQNRINAPLVWDADKQSYTPSSLVRHIVELATGVSRDFFGTQWWRDPAGWTLVELAGPLSGGKGALYREFWSRWLDRIRVEHSNWTQMSTLPAQSWITLPSPIKGTHYGLSFSAGGRIRSELYIDAGNREAPGPVPVAPRTVGPRRDASTAPSCHGRSCPTASPAASPTIPWARSPRSRTTTPTSPG